ncbi:MAG: hypothetical protein QOE80_2459 [Actinomycetota bacterium]|jgi:hypothetical protein|nr:hypothetical protein [Actinomycetota bacterium]
MPAKPPRFLPTLGLAVVWLLLYFLWVAVRPETQVTTTRPATGRSTTTTTVEPLFKFKP